MQNIRLLAIRQHSPQVRAIPHHHCSLGPFDYAQLRIIHHLDGHSMVTLTKNVWTGEVGSEDDEAGHRGPGVRCIRAETTNLLGLPSRKCRGPCIPIWSEIVCDSLPKRARPQTLYHDRKIRALDAPTGAVRGPSVIRSDRRW